jgi:cell division protein FtsW
MSLSNRINAELKGDRVIWAIVVILALFSILAVYSSTSTMAFKNDGGNTEIYLIKQVTLLSMGLLITYGCYLMHYKRYSLAAPYMLVIAVILLLLTFMVGVEINKAQRWLMVPGIGITFQTSDFAKLAIVMYVARSISAKQEYIDDFQSAFLPIIIPVVMIFFLIAPENLSTAILILITCIGMMFIGRVAMKYIFLLGLLGLVAFALLIILNQAFPDFGRVSTWVERLKDFTSGTGDVSEQAQLSNVAIASGGFIGNGPGNSIQKNYLPIAYTDYIYSIIIEEYGLIGGLLILGLFVLLFFRVVRLVTIGNKTFPAMLAIGLVLMLTIQALGNMAVSVGLIPVTGLAMPVVSMGGTSLLFSCAALGMILSVSKFIEGEKSQDY